MDKSNLAHVIALQHSQRFWQVVGVHIAVAGQQQLAAVLFHHRKETAPLVFDPDRVEAFRLCANHDHDLGGIQCRENIRFIFSTCFVLQRDARKEYTPPLVGQLIVDFLRKGAVLGAAAVLIAFLVTDEHVKRLFILTSSKDTVLYLGNFGSIFLILTLCDAVRILQRRLIVYIFQEIVKAGAVAGRQVFMRSRVLDIFNTIAAKGAAPVGLGVGVVLFHNALIHGQRLVKFTDAAEIVAAVKRRYPLVIVNFGECHRAAAAFADAKGFVRGQLNVSAAHFALDNCHSFTSFTILFV